MSEGEAQSAETFGERLKRLRETAGLSQQQLADAAQVAKNTVSKTETGRIGIPHPPTVQRYARAVGVSPAELLGLSADERLQEDRWAQMDADLDEMSGLWGLLEHPARRAAIQNLRALREMQETYEEAIRQERTRAARERLEGSDGEAPS